MHSEPPARTFPDDLETTRDHRRVVRETVAVGLVTTIAAGVTVLGLWLSSAATIRDEYARYLVSIARAGAEQVDPQLHQALRDPAQRNGPLYAQAVAPLRRMQRALPDVHYVYTMIYDGTNYRLVLDAADPGDPDDDGVDDQAGLLEVYTDLDDAMSVAFGTAGKPGRAIATSEPLSDKWGTFMTGWAPLRDASGRQYGALGVDVDAAVYLAHLHRSRNWALLGLLPAALLILALSFGHYRIRLRSLRAANAAAHATRVLRLEQQRLHNVLEATKVGTWETITDANGQDIATVDERWAAMLGMRIADINAMPREDLYARLVHPDDLAAVMPDLRRARSETGAPFEFDVRMRHASGSWVWTEVRGSVTDRDATGNARRVVGTQIDVTARKAIERALVEGERNFRALFELSPVGICLADMSTGHFLQVNDSLVRSTGYSRAELLQRTFWDITPRDWHQFEGRQLAALRQQKYFGPYEKEYQRKDGSRYSVLVSGTHFTDSAGRELAWAVVQDISERKAMESELTAAAHQDKLTGLANRSLFMQWLEAAVERVRTGWQSRFAVLFLDFDHFKLVNDALGHEAGDGLLREIAARLRAALPVSQQPLDPRAACQIARFGGDEFLVLINDVPDTAEVQHMAEELLKSLAQTYSVGGRDVYSTASIGIVTSDQCIESAESVVRNADVAMYEAKRTGRSRAVMFDDGMRARLTRFVTIDTGLRKALGTPEFKLVYQPIIELQSNATVSVEALARWNHPELGPLSPSEFIPVAEESGLIVELGHWVLREACAALAGWRARDANRAPHTISVNVSRTELALGDRLLQRVREALRDSGLPAHCLRLEVTERDVMRDPAATKRLMHALRGMGVQLAMDDFGTGSSSLGCLREYPFDVIKLDRSFVHDLAGNPDVLSMIHAAITLVHNLGKSCVAEGIETRQQIGILQSLGCQYGQGYYFSHPVLADQVMELIEQSMDMQQALAG